MEFRIETAGESHGGVMTAICHGLPAGSPADPAFVDARLAERQTGRGTGPRQKIEQDRVRLLSGVRDGVTTGNPIALQVDNRDTKYSDLPPIHEPRPGHADLAGALNLVRDDARDIVERASARETAARVACGALAQQFLRALGIEVFAHTVALGGIELPAWTPPATSGDALATGLKQARAAREQSDLRALAEGEAADQIRAAIDRAHAEGDTLGGLVEIVALGVPPGLGGHQRPEDKLSANLAGALMGIQAVRGVEIGLGFRGAALPGSDVHDAILPPQAGEVRPRRSRNHAGGIEGGTSNGEPVFLRIAMKPLATLRERLPSVDLRTGEAAPARYERSDTTAVPRLVVVAEAVTAAVLAHHIRRRFGGATLAEVREAMAAHHARLAQQFGADEPARPDDT